MTGTITARIRGGHATYYLDGTKLPGGSTLAGMMPKDLTNWYAQQAAEYAVNNWDTLGQLELLDRVKTIQGAAKAAVTKAAKRGTDCHTAMEDLANGRPTTTDDPTVLADAEAAVRLMDKWQIQPVATEIGLANLNGADQNTSELYAGTADLVARSDLLGGQYLMDYKFGKNHYATHAIQLSAYAHATHSIVEIPQYGPRGGTLKPSYELAGPPQMNQHTAYIIHAHDGVAELLPVCIDGWVWEAVMTACYVYWEWESRTGWNYRNSDNFADPIGPPRTHSADPVDPSDPAPF